MLFPRLTRSDRLFLWDQRLQCRARVHSLPMVLASAPRSRDSLAEIHALLHHWPPLPPAAALELLQPRYLRAHDQHNVMRSHMTNTV